MNIRFHRNFEKRYARIPPSVRKQFKERSDVFMRNPYDPILQNHALKGKYQGYRSINITGDYRAVYKFIDGNMIIFVDLGTHSELYS